MHQRWHSDDLAGRLIRRMIEDKTMDQWTILCLPAVAEPWAAANHPVGGRANNARLNGWHGVADEADAAKAGRAAGNYPVGDQHGFVEKAVRAAKDGWWMAPDALGREPGEPLWPEKYDLQALKQIETNVGAYEWAALYQQRPRKMTGNLIKAHKIKVIEPDEVPQGLRVYRYWDLAVGRSASAHDITGTLGGMDAQRNFYLIHMAVFRPPWSDAKPKMVRRMLEDPMSVVQGIEVAGQQDGYYQDFRDDPMLHERTIKPVAPKGDKVSRAQLWATRIPDGQVFMVRGPWNDGFVEEALMFPKGAADNRVDGVSGLWQMCPLQMGFGDVPQSPDVRSRWDVFGERVGFAGAARSLWE
jgi:predicted phage terminase large subunit-like protein